MPFEWNNRIVVTKDELVPNWFTWSNLKVTLHRYRDKPTGPKRLQLGGNGRVMLIDFDTLPPHIQHGLGDPRLVKHVLEKYYKTDKEAVRYFQQYTFEDGTYLDFDCQNRYTLNASVLRAVLNFKADLERENKKKSKGNAGIYGALCQHCETFNKTLAVKHKDEHTLPGSEKRFKEVLNAFESKGFKSLISAKHKNSNSRKVDGDTLALLESMFAKDHTKPTATEVYRRYELFLSGNNEIINNSTAEIFSPADFKSLSISTVKNYLAAWDSKIGTHLSRSGDRQKYMQVYKPYHSLDKPKFAGSILSIDDRQPPFKMADGKRLWFYNGIDLASEAFTCWVYGKTKEDIIVVFYRKLVRNYAEWGLCLPYELEAEMSLNSSFTETFLQEGVMFDEVRIEANNARGKRIEAYYRALRYDLEKKREGWLARPFALSEANQAGSHEVKTQYYEEIIEGCKRDIQTWNNMPHSVHKHLTRWEVFMQMQHPDLKPINYIGILPHLGYKTATSCGNNGFIRLQGNNYLLGQDGEISTGDKLISFMERVGGRDVTVCWLDGNDGKVLKALVYIGIQLICEAIIQPTYNRAKLEQTQADSEALEIMSKYVATIEAYGRRRKNAIDGVTIIDRTPPVKKVFVMPGLKQQINIESAAEILPDPDNEIDYQPERSFVRSLKDRF